MSRSSDHDRPEAASSSASWSAPASVVRAEWWWHELPFNKRLAGAAGAQPCYKLVAMRKLRAISRRPGSRRGVRCRRHVLLDRGSVRRSVRSPRCVSRKGVATRTGTRCADRQDREHPAHRRVQGGALNKEVREIGARRTWPADYGVIPGGTRSGQGASRLQCRQPLRHSQTRRHPPW